MQLVLLDTRSLSILVVKIISKMIYSSTQLYGHEWAKVEGLKCMLRDSGSFDFIKIGQILWKTKVFLFIGWNVTKER